MAAAAPGEIVPSEIVLHAGAGEPSRRVIDRTVTLGGSQADGIAVAGLAPAAVRLEPRPAGLVVRPAVPGLRLAGRPVPPGGHRLLRPGERATLHALALELLPPRSGDGPTRAAAAMLLRDAVDGRALTPGPRLVLLTGSDAGERVALASDLVVGRGRAAGLRLRDPAASRRHARIRRSPAGVSVEDLGAKNRVRVNGVAIDRRRLVHLMPGDCITIGETELAYEDGATPAAAPPRPARARPPRGRERGARPLAVAAVLAASAAALAAVSSCGS